MRTRSASVTVVMRRRVRAVSTSPIMMPILLPSICEERDQAGRLGRGTDPPAVPGAAGSVAQSPKSAGVIPETEVRLLVKRDFNRPALTWNGRLTSPSIRRQTSKGGLLDLSGWKIADLATTAPLNDRTCQPLENRRGPLLPVREHSFSSVRHGAFCSVLGATIGRIERKGVLEPESAGMQSPTALSQHPYSNHDGLSETN